MYDTLNQVLFNDTAHPPTPSVSSYLPPLLYDSKRFWHQTGRKQLLKQEHSLFQTTKRLKRAIFYDQRPQRCEFDPSQKHCDYD